MTKVKRVARTPQDDRARDLAMQAAREQAAKSKHKIPYDADGKNGDRAAWAESAIRAFQIETGTDWDDTVKDLLCDLMHFCDRNTFEDGENHFDFEAALNTARMHYEAETTKGG